MWTSSRPVSPVKKSTNTTDSKQAHDDHDQSKKKLGGGKDHMNMQSVQDSLPDIRMATAKGVPSSNLINFGNSNASTGNNNSNFNLKFPGMGETQDVHMETLKRTVKKPGAVLQLWERELLDAPEVKRKATVAQLCEFFPPRLLKIMLSQS